MAVDSGELALVMTESILPVLKEDVTRAWRCDAHVVDEVEQEAAVVYVFSSSEKRLTRSQARRNGEPQISNSEEEYAFTIPIKVHEY